jgi:ribose transport system substrate-binding protein
MGLHIGFLRVGSLRVAVASILLAGSIFATAGCGGGGDSSGSSESSKGGSGKSAFPKAAKANEEFEQRPTSVGLKTPVGKPIPTGKTIDFIQCGVPACKTEGEIFEAAASVLGWKIKSVNAGTTPEEIKAAYEQAIKDEPDAVLGSGYPRALFEPELHQLEAMNIPVIEFFVNDEAGNGITAVIGGPKSSEIQGQMMADYILAQSTDESMQIGSVITQGFETNIAASEALKKLVATECPECSVKMLEAPVSSTGSDLPQRIAGFFTSNPDIDWASIAYSDMVSGLPTALKGSGVEDVQLTTVHVSPSVAPYMTNDEYLRSSVGASYDEVYWRGIDLLARLFAGVSYKEDLDDSTFPYWTITKETLPSSTEEFANVVDFEGQYKKLWGVG